MRFSLLSIFLLPFSLNAMQFETHVSEVGGYSIDLPEEWGDYSDDGNTFRYEEGGLYFHIDIKPFDYPTSLERWIVDSAVDNKDMPNMTFRDMHYSAGRISGSKVIRFVANVTRSESTLDEETFAHASYNFVHQGRGFEIKLFAHPEICSHPETILDEIMQSFKIKTAIEVN